MGMKRRSYARSRIAILISTVLVGTLLQGALTPTAAQADDLPGIPASEKALTGHGVKMLPRKRDSEPKVPQLPPKHAWPQAGSAKVSVPAAGKAGAVRAGRLPVSLTRAKAAKKGVQSSPLTGQATVRVLDHQSAVDAGVDGVLLAVEPTAHSSGGAIGVRVDYSAFAQAFGGSQSARLRLVQLPHCAATTPQLTSCTAQHPVRSVNDESAQTLSADSVALPAAKGAASSGSSALLLAVTSGTSSDHGDYSASKLSASAAWQTNLSTGDFSWSYDMPTPSVPGGFGPEVGLSYSSAAIDGRTANTNNQSSWAGDGFDLWPGFIERNYKPCSDDGVTVGGNKPGDLCWAYDNATISFNGHAGELIPSGTNSWKIKGDDGTKIDRLYGSGTNVRANGARNDEYWRVTTTDGTRYYFGENRLPGWTTGLETTDSVWTAPVFGDDADEPCNATTFAASWCQQAWRWNLDYAVDVHGNAIAYYYNKETNNYGRALTAADETPYDRGGYLDRIEYGLKSSSSYSPKALAKVDFNSLERCLPETGVTCEAATIDDKSFYWYDTPWDLNCKSGADCYNASPSFFTRKRLTGVTTSVLKSDGTYTPVDSWALNHKWGMADIDYQLLLDSIQHTGQAETKENAPDITLPKVTFAYDQRANRLDVPGDETAPFIKERLSTVSDESGGQIDVNYSNAVCDSANLPSPQTNTTRCFPQYFTKQGDTNPTLQWFNKYVVDSVIQTDRTNTAPDMVTRYSYLGGAAWHYDDDDGLTKEKYKTWSTYRGYSHVQVQTGGQDPVGVKSQTDHYFLRGMDGDKESTSGGTKSVTVTDDNGATITDHDSAAGFEYKTETYSGPGGKVLSKSFSTPWHHETASRTRSWGTTTANLTGTLNTWSWTSLDDGAGSSWRKTYISYSHENTAGRVVMTHDAGDSSTGADNTCTRTTYVDNITAWILNAPSRVETVGVACATAPDRSKNVISDTRTAYDGQAYDAAPTKGDATRISTLNSHDGTTGTYLESGITVDGYGRQTSATDLSATVTATETTAPVRTARSDGRTTSTLYTPATGFPATMAVTTPPATAGDTNTAQTTTTTYDPVRGVPLTVMDTNNKLTDTTYDALGRKLKIWLPNRSKANQVPNYSFAYTIADSKPVSVATSTLAGTGTHTSYALYDGFLRPRQIQAPGPQSGMLVSDTFYDERGLVSKSFAPYYAVKAPSTTLFALDEALKVETQTWNTYDGLGRVIQSKQVAGNGDGGPVLATTATTYGGDRTTVTPPQGATPTTTVSDARGHVTELRQYHATTATGAYDKTTYGYDVAGHLKLLTDPAGNQWSYNYDQQGRQIQVDDPDSGTSHSHFDDRGQLDVTTDSRNKSVTHIYDNLGRETETHDGTATGPLLTKHVYDPTGFKGQLASSTRYVDGATGAAYTTNYQLYDTLYRPHRTTTTIPSSEGALAGSYQANVQYNVDGTVQSAGYPAAGALTAEVITPTYDEVQRPETLTGNGGVTYVTDTAYSFTGKPLQYTLQSGAKFTQVTNSYQWGTQRLSNSRVDRQDVPGVDKSSTYGYDEAGNITSINDVSRDGTDNQCFTYDYLQRLTEAWAQNTGTCAKTPTASVLGGPAPYWQSYEYDLTGNRKSETDHDPSGDAAKNTSHTYTYPPAKSPQPHTLTQVQTTGPNGTAIDSYTYLPNGSTKTRTIGGDTQTLDWDSEGHLATVTAPDASGGTKTTTYLYDADGNRLIERTPTASTLYLGSTEITLAKGATTPTAQRYYNLGSGNQAIRTNDNKLSFLVGDHHGTSQLAINAADLTMQQRRSTPFGPPRGSQPTNWPGQKGFIGGTKDATTGLTHLGARDYDPSTGRFISVDPVMDLTDPQQINGYAYANNNPVTASDPTGLFTDDGTGHSEPRTDGGPSGPASPHPGIPGGGGGGGNSQHDSNSTGTGDYGKNEQQRARQSWITRWSPKTKNARTLRSWFYSHGTGQGGGDYWVNEVGEDGSPSNVCFGREGCRQAYIYLLNHPQDIAGAKEIAATYCVKNYSKCHGDGRLIDAVTSLTKEVEDIILLRGMLKVACSFKKSTQVLMDDGSRKGIGKIKPGEKVQAADPVTGKHAGARTVAASLVHHDDDLTDVAIRTKGGRMATVHTTSRHPFWDATTHTWVPAGRLVPGHRLNTATGKNSFVVAVRVTPGSADMYNLTVGQLHTYYVLAGQTPVLVHNSTCPEVDEISRNISNHALESAKRPDGDGTHFVRGVDDGALPYYVDGVINGNVPNVETRYLRNGRVGYWDPAKRSVVIEDGEGGTVFTPKDGKDWFDNVLR
ncbi:MULTISPECIES: RHS repeat-associated core domain-containing protein [Streptomyces]|uniref:RHS repeat-associated core domain-containing protein n=1 Tax=Streptomyces TaxID=1883 RepID=UPI0033999222